MLVRYGAEGQPVPFETPNDCSADLTTMVGCSRVVLFPLDTCPRFPDASSSEGLKRESCELWPMSVTYCVPPLIKAQASFSTEVQFPASTPPPPSTHLPPTVLRKRHCCSSLTRFISSRLQRLHSIFHTLIHPSLQEVTP